MMALEQRESQMNILTKRASSPSTSGARTLPTRARAAWIKIKNPAYSQAAGWHEQFTRYRRLAV